MLSGNHIVKVDLDQGKIAKPTKCPRSACWSPNSMQIVRNRSRFADKQVTKLQETPASVPAGQAPHSLWLCAYDELVDMCKAGERVEIIGIFRCSPVRVNPKQRALKNEVDVLHIQKVDKKPMAIDVFTVDGAKDEGASRDIEETRKITGEEVQKIKETYCKTRRLRTLSRSLAPSISEMDDVKKGPCSSSSAERQVS